MTPPRTTQGGRRPPFRRGGRRRRQCVCKEGTVDYKNVSSIRRFITDRGRIEAGKKSGNCAKCQRALTIAIKRARHLALLPYAPEHLRVTGTVSADKISDEEEETPAEEVAGKAEAKESTDTAAATEEAPAAEVVEEATGEVAEETVEEVEESEKEETESATENVSTDEAPETEETDDDSSDEEDK